MTKMVFVHSNEIQFDGGIINQEIFFTKISMLKFSLSKNDIFRMKGSECCVWYSFPAEWNSKLFPLYYLFGSVFMHWMSRTEQKKARTCRNEGKSRERAEHVFVGVLFDGSQVPFDCHVKIHIFFYHDFCVTWPIVSQYHTKYRQM